MRAGTAHPTNRRVDCRVEIAILPVTESDPSLLQALEASSPGSGGLVFDRVDALDPPLGPFPSGRLRLTG